MTRAYRRDPSIVARDARICAAYRAGVSATVLASQEYIAVQGIRAILVRNGVPARGNPAGRPAVPVVAPDGTEVGASIAEAAARLGVCRSAVVQAGAQIAGVLYLRRLPGLRRGGV